MLALIAIGLAGQFTPAGLRERVAVWFGNLPSWSLGATSEQIGIADGHRGWKRHPDGRLSALGTSPETVGSGRGSSGWDGSAAAKSAWV